MCPDCGLVSMPSHLAALDTGFTSLTRFDREDSDGTAVGVLEREEEGYKEIYKLLRVIDPSLPHFRKVAANTSTFKTQGLIWTKKEIRWHNVHGEISLFLPVLVHLEERGAISVPVCDIRHLASLIHEQKVSFWSALGSALTLAALFLEAIAAIALAHASEVKPLQQNSAEISRPNVNMRPTEQKTGKTYVMYVNHPTSTVTIHSTECRYYQNREDEQTPNGYWMGSFSFFKDAENRAAGAGKKRVRICKVCLEECYKLYEFNEWGSEA